MLIYLITLLLGLKTISPCGELEDSLLQCRVWKSQRIIERSYPRFSYAEKTASEILETIDSDTILIFGYGSLVNKESAADNLEGNTLQTFEPAVGFGLKRIFNRNIPKEAVIERFGELVRSEDTAALNVLITGDPSHLVNGVIFKVGLEDLDSLLTREIGYDFVPIPVVSWEEYLADQDEASLNIAYLFVAEKGTYGGVDMVRHDINPVPAYAQLALRGAMTYGPKFAALWKKTTFLSDGTTSFTEWEANPSLSCHTGTCH